MNITQLCSLFYNDSNLEAVTEDFLKEIRELQESNMAMRSYIERITQKLLENKALEYLFESDSVSSTPCMPSMNDNGGTNSRTVDLSYGHDTDNPLDHSTGLSLPKPGSIGKESPLATERIARRRSRIGVGLNIEIAGSSGSGFRETTRVISPLFGSNAWPPASSKSKSPIISSPRFGTGLNTGEKSGADFLSYRRVSSHGQKKLLPLQLKDGISVQREEADGTGTMQSQVIASNPIEDREYSSYGKQDTAPDYSVENSSFGILNIPKKKRRSWFGIFNG